MVSLQTQRISRYKVNKFHVVITWDVSVQIDACVVRVDTLSDVLVASNAWSGLTKMTLLSLMDPVGIYLVCPGFTSRDLQTWSVPN